MYVLRRNTHPHALRHFGQDGASLPRRIWIC
jgi:hypothetical protein